jgi:hypothetical protein
VHFPLPVALGLPYILGMTHTAITLIPAPIPSDDTVMGYLEHSPWTAALAARLESRRPAHRAAALYNAARAHGLDDIACTPDGLRIGNVLIETDYLPPATVAVQLAIELGY